MSGRYYIEPTVSSWDRISGPGVEGLLVDPTHSDETLHAFARAYASGFKDAAIERDNYRNLCQSHEATIRALTTSTVIAERDALRERCERYEKAGSVDLENTRCERVTGQPYMASPCGECRVCRLIVDIIATRERLNSANRALKEIDAYATGIIGEPPHTRQDRLYHENTDGINHFDSMDEVQRIAREALAPRKEQPEC